MKLPGYLGNKKLSVSVLFLVFALFTLSYAAGPTWTQTDWSGGSGQDAWSVVTRYQSDDGHAQVNYPNGEVSIKSALNTGAGTVSLNVSGGNQVVNSYTYVTTVMTNSGSSIITVNDVSNFAVDDEILIIQIQDSSLTHSSMAGVYEFRKIRQINGFSFTLDSLLGNTYYSGRYNDSLSSVTQVVKVPNYSSVLVQNSGGITSSVWNGTTGGIVAFRAKDTVRINAGCAISVNGLGFRGGSNPGSHEDGFKGQSWDGGNDTTFRGGYNHCGAIYASIPNAGGGGCYVNGAGGSYGGSGGTVGDAYGGCTGQAGLTYGNVTLSRIYFGSGGGGGHSNGGQPHGGPGGGIILIFARVIIVNGTVSANGGDGYQVTQQGQWGAGGGAGGTIYLGGINVTIGANQVTASGGNRYNGINGGGHGGNGGDGRIRIDWNSLSGSTTPAAWTGYQVPINDSTYVTSSIYDMTSAVTGPYMASWSASYNSGQVKVRVRTSANADMSGATSWNSCDTVVNGGILRGQTGISPNQRYVQYQIRLFKSGSATPSFQDITAEFNQPPSAATLIAPANGGANQSQTPVFTWSACTDANTSDAVSYVLEVSPQSNLSTLLFRRPVSLPTYSAVSGDNIQGHQTYYWRVYAKDGYPDSTASPSIYSFTTQNNYPAAFAVTAPSNGTEAAVTPRLAWNASSDSDPVDSGSFTYKVEIANDSFFVNKVLTKTGLAKANHLYDVASADSLKGHRTYYWRVYAKDTYPDSTLSSNFLMFKTRNNAPSASALLSPANTVQLTDKTPLLTWSSASDADSVDANSLNYILEVSDDVGFASSHVVLRRQTLALSQYQAASGELKGHMTYYWRVYAKDTYPDSTASSNTWSFKTVNTKPNAFALSSPSDLSSVSRTPYLTWNSAVDPDSIDANSLTYVVEISTTSNFSNIILQKWVGANNYQVVGIDNLSAPATYYWRVWARDSYPDSTLCTSSFQFTTYSNHAPNPIAALRTPADNWILSTFYPIFAWDSTTDADNDPLSFILEISPKTDFSILKVRKPGIGTCQYTLTSGDPLDGNTKYYWRVFAKDNHPDSSVSTGTFSLRTPNTPPGAFGLSLPSNGQTVSKTPTLTWIASTDADPTDTALTYIVEIANNNGFSPIFVRKSVTGSTQYAVQPGDNLVGNATYYWRVWAKDTKPDSTCSPSQNFRTQNTFPQAFTLVGPSAGIDTNTTPVLSWNASHDVDPVDSVLSYIIEISTSSSFSTLMARKTVLKTTEYPVVGQDGLKGHMTYYWRVWAKDTYSDSVLCGAAFNFRTHNNPPAAFVITSPSDNIMTNTVPSLSWNNSSDPDPVDASSLTYVLEVSPASDFSNVVLRKTGLISSPYQVQLSDSLRGHLKYYWRVWAKDTKPDSTLSGNVLSFRTQNTPPSGVTLISPANAATVDQQPLFEWSQASDPDTVDKVLTHILEISATNDFSNIVVRKINLTSSRYRINPSIDVLSGNMTYYWRVWTKDSYPDSTLSAGYFSFTTQNHLPEAFDLVSPLPGSEVSTRPLFIWQASNDMDIPDAGKLKYVLEIDSSASFASPILRKSVSNGVQYQFGSSENLPDKSVLYWRVWAKDTKPDSIVSLSTIKFFTCNQNSPPQLSLPLMPGNNTVVPLNNALSWTRRDPDPGDTLHYNVRLSSTADFAAIVAAKTGWLGTGITVSQLDNSDSLKDNCLYYWQVEAIDPHGLSSGFTAGANAYFICKRQNNPPTKPYNLYPPDTIAISAQKYLKWKAEDPDSIGLTPDTLSYTLTVSKTQDFANPIGITVASKDSIQLDSLTNFSQMTDNTKYYWKIYATDNHGLSGPSTDGSNAFWVNLLNKPPALPTPRIPAANAGVGPMDSLAWNAAADPNPFDKVAYVVQIGKTGDFVSIIVNDTLNGTSVRLNTVRNYKAMQTGATYFWRVLAYDLQNAASGWAGGGNLSFTFVATSPAVPVTAYPINGGPVFPTEQFTWGKSGAPNAGAADSVYYVLQVDASNAFDAPVSMDTVTDTAATVEDIPNYNKFIDLSRYYWRVKSFNNHGAASDWSMVSACILTKSNHAPPTPLSIGPADSAVLAASSQLYWNRSIDPDPTDSVTYSVISARDGGFKDTVLKVTGIKDTTVTIAALLAGNKIVKMDNGRDTAVDTAGFLKNRFYQWKVAAVDNHRASSPFSSGHAMYYHPSSDTPAVPSGLVPAFSQIAFPSDFLRWVSVYVKVPGDTVSFIIQAASDSAFIDASVLSLDTVKIAQQIQINKLSGYGSWPTERYLFWRVKSMNKARESYGYSKPAKFFFSTKHLPPETPVQVYPLTATSVVYPPDTLVWNPSFDVQGDSVYYEVMIAQSAFDSTADSNAVPIRVHDLPVTKLVLNKIVQGYNLLKHNKTSYWRVRGRDTHNFFSSWSSLGAFTYMSRQPTAPDSLYPPSNSPVMVNDAIGWRVASDVDAGPRDTLSYVVMVAKDVRFTAVVSEDTVKGDTKLAVRAMRGESLLGNDTTYNWKVQALNVHGAASDFTAPAAFYFQRKFVAPNRPDSLWPVIGHIVRPFESLRWRGTSPNQNDTLSYRIDISRDTNFSIIVASVRKDSLQYIPIDRIPNYKAVLKVDSVYFWRVQATNKFGETSPFSTHGEFLYKDKDQQASAPVVLSPAFGAYMVASDLVTWRNSADPDDSLIIYKVEISPDSGFSTATAHRDSIAQGAASKTSVTLSSFTGADSLKKNTFYYLRIYPMSRVDTLWAPGYTSAIWQIWNGDTILAGNKQISSVTVITPQANGKNPLANIARSIDNLVTIVFPDSAVLEPVAAKISFIPIRGTVGYNDSTLPKTTDPLIRKLAEMVAGANKYAMGNLQTYYVREGAYVIHLYPLASPDSLAQLKDTVLFQIAYHDTNSDGYVDGETRIKVSDLRVFSLNEKTGRWEVTPSYSLETGKTPTAGRAQVLGKKNLPVSINSLSLLTPHFSAYSILAYKEIKTPFANFKVYPSPFKIAGTGKQATIEYMLNEPADVEIRIFDNTGVLVKSISIKAGEDFGSAGLIDIPWNGRNGFGRLVGNGMYLIKIMAKPKNSGGTYHKQQFLGVVK